MKGLQEKHRLFAEITEQLSAFYPELFAKEENDKINVIGRWNVFAESEYIDSYFIKIELPNDYPQSVPKVWEISYKLKKNRNTHFNPPDNHACLFAPPERWEKWPIGASFIEFLDGPVAEFFFSQAYYQLTGEWIFGQRSHGADGIIEYYYDKLDLKDKKILKDCLMLCLEKKFARQWKCPCNSERRLIKCHGPQLISLKKVIPLEEIRYAISIL